MNDKFDTEFNTYFDDGLDEDPNDRDPDVIPDDGMFPKYVLTPRQQAEKTERMVDAVTTLEQAFPDRLKVQVEQDVIRTVKLTPDLDPETNAPLPRLFMEIETDLAQLGLGQTQDMAEPPASGYIIVQYRTGDPVDQEHHFHFETEADVVEYIRSKIAPH